jgi:hypothetical protein
VDAKSLRPKIAALIPPIDLACMGELDDGIIMRLGYWLYAEGPRTDADWVLNAIRTRPGTWTARLCRALHDKPETYRSIVYCGACTEYANPRKRRRSKIASLNRLLPGYEAIGGAHILHRPCNCLGLTWMRKTLYKLRDQGSIEMKQARIIDHRQARGWDIATRLYPIGGAYNE